jgi:hypothetical protein
MAVHTNREALSLPAIETVRQIVSELFVSNFAASAVA